MSELNQKKIYIYIYLIFISNFNDVTKAITENFWFCTNFVFANNCLN